MPQSDTVACALGAWTQLTNADATSVTFQVKGAGAVEIKRGAGTAPTDFDGSLRYDQWQGEMNQSLDSIFPGITGARLWAYATDSATSVAIQHA